MELTFDLFNKKLLSYVTKNEDMVNRYEDITGDNIDAITYDIYQQYRSLSLLCKISINNALDTAINIALRENTSLTDAMSKMIADVQRESSEKSSMQTYFKDINDIYMKNNNNYDIEYCPENRDKLIEMNLKSVISVAKAYQGMGVPLEDLISAGNVGLCEAFNKYDPERAKLKDNILDAIESLGEEVTLAELKEAIGEYLSYGDVKKKFVERFKDKEVYKKSDILKWVRHNIQNAKFNSVAMMWIKAYILIEIDNNSRLVKKPKSEVQKDKEKYGSYKKEQLLDIDAPINGENGAPLSEILTFEDDARAHLDVEESQKVFKQNLNQLLEGVKSRDRRILLEKFGIGLPRPMLPKEISEQEGLSIARISQILQSTIDTMRYNQVKYGIDETVLYEALEKMI